MAFHFRLQSVQKVQEFQRDEEKMTLAELLAQEKTLSTELEALKKKLDDTRMERLQWMENGKLQMAPLLQYHQYENRLKKEADNLADRHQELLIKIELQRNSLLDSEREVKKFEKLEEKQREDYRKSQKK